MDAHRWNRINELFDAVYERPPGDREAFLKAACGEDVALYRDVRELLAEDTHTHSLLDGVAIDAIDLLDELSWEGQRIGPYVIVRELGRGGMGHVYLAERADGEFEQQVALKLVKRGMDSEQILRRFRSERQILARLQHPHIARLLDGGIADDGRPYFAMEYVAGEPITDYCDARRLTVDERLALFQDVCKAVLYAHAHLVVHRDLKPSNILVADDGSVKLLDFGIAKVLVEEEEGGTALTREGLRVMTPEYASPEQVRNEPVNTSTDIYSLGVVLYELLAGHRPYQLTSRSPVDVEQVVCHTEPERPSTAVSRGTDSDTVAVGSPEAISQARGTERGRLRRRLTGDLDVICLKALKKEPERRYASVEAFVEDVRRHLEGLPVVARPDRAGYRLRKFVHRHRTGVFATIAVVVGVSLLVSFYTVRLKHERDRARLEAEKAEQVAAFLQGIFEVSDPAESRGEVITARELLDEGARRIEQELASQPEVQARMMGVAGKVYQSLGLYEQAQPLLEQALVLTRRHYGEAHPEVAHGWTALGSLLQEVGNYEEAAAHYQRALDLHRRLQGEVSTEVASSLHDIAMVIYEQGNYDEAERRYREALALARRTQGEDNELVAMILTDLGAVVRHKGNFEEAEPLYREALAIRRALYGDTHLSVAESLNHLSRLLYNQGAYEAAEPLAREGLALRRTFYGDAHPAVAASFGSLAGVLSARGDQKGAEDNYRRALAIIQETLGAEHPYAMGLTYSLANVLAEQKDFATAEPLMRQALAGHREILPAGHINMAYPLIGLGSMLTEMGSPEEAIPLLREALDVRRATLPEGHWRIAVAQSALGAALTSAGQYAEAEGLLIESFETLHKEQGADDDRTLTARQRVMTLYEAWGKPEQAAAYRGE